MADNPDPNPIEQGAPTFWQQIVALVKYFLPKKKQ
jgi:hypothetical protein